MADNVAITAGAGTTVSTEEITTLNGGAVSAQHIQRMVAALRTADGVASDLPGDTANGLDVDVTRLPALPTGTNVIGALTANQSINNAQVSGTAIDVNSGVKSAGTMRVVIATDQPALTNKLLVTPDSVALPANQSVNNAQINGIAPLMGNGITGTGSQRVTIASDNTAFSVNSIPPVLTKGTQGATGYSIQNLKDAGRNAISFFTVLPIITTASDALLSLTGYKSGAAVAATTTPAVVTTAKTFRVTSIVLTHVSIATAGSTRFSLRANTSGVVLVGSAVVASWVVGAVAAVAGLSTVLEVPVPDGLEFAAGTGIGITIVGLSTVQALAANGYGSVTLFGFEY